MASRSAALRVGMFVLCGIVALLAVVFFLSGSVLHPGTPFETYFQESVQGLDVGTGGEISRRGPSARLPMSAW